MPGVTEGPAAGLTISVVIPTLNEQPAVAAVLESTRGAGVERIVVDGASDLQMKAVRAEVDGREGVGEFAVGHVV